jgi:WD40 repeat protein
VFISYGRADASDFAGRLFRDLERDGFTVWMDRDRIDPGAPFDARIEAGIRGSDVVLAAMSRRSLEPDSICRDEVTFALQNYKTLVPLRIDPDPAVTPTLLLARRNWLDFTGGYDEGLASLRRFLGGDPGALREPTVNSVTGRRPLDFSEEIARFSAGFTGRRWLASEIDQWIDRKTGGVLVIVAGPGIGKSAIAAWLGQRSDVAALHFCTQQNSRSLDPQDFVASIVGQLAVRVPGYGDAVTSQFPEVPRANGTDAFRELVIEPSRRLTPPQKPFIIVVDALDEAAARNGETIVDLLVTHSSSLPRWLRLVTTARPEESLLGSIRGALGVYELNADRRENREDLLAFVQARLSVCLPGFTPPASLRLAQQIAERAQGLFLHARLILDALAEGELGPDDIEKLPPGLGRLYSRVLTRHYHNPEDFSRVAQPVCGALVAARGWVPLSLLQRICGRTSEEVRRTLLEMRALLMVRHEGEPTYALFHQSVRDWLVDSDSAGYFWCDAQLGNVRLAEACWQDYVGGPAHVSSYALAHVVAHLCAAGRAGDVAVLLFDLEFLQEKIRRDKPQALIDDAALGASLYRGRPGATASALEHLQGALRLSARALATYPDQLCAQLLGRLIGDGHDRIPALVTRAAEWRAADWLRPLTASLISPAGALVRTVFVHSRTVTALAIMPDGTHVLSGSQDERLLLWNLTTGQIQHEFGRHDSGVRAVAVSQDGRLAVSGGNDGTVKLWDLERRSLLGEVKHARQVADAALSSDGTWGASVSVDNELKVWTTDPLEEIDAAAGDYGTLWSVAVTSDDLHVLTGSRDGIVRSWALAPLREEHRWQAHSSAPPAVDGPTETRPTGASRRSSSSGHPPEVSDIVAVDEGRYITCGGDGRLRIWDVSEDEALGGGQFTNRPLRALAVISDDSLAMASADGTVLVWNIDENNTVTVAAHSRDIGALAAAPDKDLLLSGSGDSVIRQWSISRLRTQPSRVGHRLHVLSAEIAAGGRLAATLGGGEIAVWDLDSGGLRSRFDSPKGMVTLRLSADGDLAIGDDVHGHVFVVALADGSVRAVIGGQLESFLKPASRILRGGTLAATVGENVLNVWELPSLRLLASLDCDGGVDQLTVRSDETLIVGWGLGAVTEWNPVTGEQQQWRRGAISGDTLSLADVKPIAGGLIVLSDSTLEWWTAPGTISRRYRVRVSDYRFRFDASADGAVVAIGAGADGTLVVEPAAARTSRFVGDDPTASLAISPDGRTIVVGETGGGVHILRREGRHPT